MILTVTTLILAILATARLTRMVTTDRIFEAPRIWLLRKIVRRYGEEHLLAYLPVCNWCASVYVATGVYGAWASVGGTPWFQVPVTVLALSYAAGWLASKEGGE